MRAGKQENSHCGSEKFSFKAIKTFITTTKNVENVSGAWRYATFLLRRLSHTCVCVCV